MSVQTNKYTRLLTYIIISNTSIHIVFFFLGIFSKLLKSNKVKIKHTCLKTNLNNQSQLNYITLQNLKRKTLQCEHILSNVVAGKFFLGSEDIVLQAISRQTVLG